MARKPYFQYELVGKNNRILKDGDNFDKASKFNLYYKDEIVLKNEPFPKRIKSANAKSNYIYKSKENIKAYIKQVEKELARQLLEESKKEKVQKEKIKKEKIKKEAVKITDKELRDLITKKPKPEILITKESEEDFEEEFEREFEIVKSVKDLIWFEDGIVNFNWKEISISQFVDILSMNRVINDDTLFLYYKKNFSKISFSGSVKNYKVPYVKPVVGYSSYSNVFFENNVFFPFIKVFLIKDTHPKTSLFIKSKLKEAVLNAYNKLKKVIDYSKDSEINSSFHVPFFSVQNGEIVNHKLATMGYEDLYENSISTDYLLTVSYFESTLEKIITDFANKLPIIIERDNYANQSVYEAKGLYLSGISFHISHKE